MKTRLSHAFGGAGRATAFLLGAQAVTAGAAFLVSLLAAAVMLPEGRGELALWLQITYLVGTISILGLERPLAAHSEGTAAGTVGLSLRLTRPAALCLGAAMLAAFVWWQLGPTPSLALLALLGAVYAVSSIPIRSVRVAFIVSRTWRPYVTATVAMQGVILIGASLLAVAQIDSVTAWAALYAGTALAVGASIVIFSLGAQERSIETDISRRRLQTLGLRLLPASLGNTAMLRSDRLLLPALSNSRELGLYIIVATATEIASWPVQQYVDASLRKWRTSSADARRTTRYVVTGTGIGTLLAVLAGATAWLAISLWLPAYRDSLSLIPPLLAAAALYSATRVQQGLLLADGRTGAVSTVEIGGMAASVLLYIALIPENGALGAAWGSLIGYGITTVLGHLALRKSR